MINVRSAFPDAREKNRRTVRGKKPARYLANAPTLNALIGKMYPNVPVYHNEVYRGYRRHWYLIHDTALLRYGYVHIQEHDRSPFEINCNSMESLQHMCQDIERRAIWNPDLIELVTQVAQQIAPGGSKAGLNVDFIDMVKKKFPEQFVPKPAPVPVSKYNPFYSLDKKPYRYLWGDENWIIDDGYDYSYSNRR